MAEDEEAFEAYHVPQQSRRDKLRVVLHHQNTTPPTTLFYNNNSNNNNQACLVKDEATLMGFVSSSSSSNHHFPLTTPLNPNNPNYPFLYNLQTLRDCVDYTSDHHQVGVFNKQQQLQQLSLSLSSSSPHNQSSSLPLELNLQQRVLGNVGNLVSSNVVRGSGSTSNEVSRCSVPLGPFTGYASILKGSRFLRPAQQLLEELCDVGRGVYGERSGGVADSGLMDPTQPPSIERLSGIDVVDDDDPLGGGGDHGSEGRRKKSRLISMLDEVCRRYKQYYQQMQTVIASFECVAGLGNAAPYANLALKAMSRHFRSLKNAITEQLQFAGGKSYCQQPSHGKEATGFGSSADHRLVSYNPQRSAQNSGYVEHHPVWRPQRGLPERAVTVLRAWLFEHFLHPYPTDTDKMMLAKQTGLSRSQVSNWFINARVRLWKPMVEEIHMLETRQAQKTVQREDRTTNNRSSDNVPTADPIITLDNPSTSTQIGVQEIHSRRSSRNELMPDLPNEQPVNLPYAGMGVMGGNSSSGVSLTLGLHQNNVINAAQRFGLGHDGSSEGYVMGGGFEPPNRQFGRNVIGGQLLHDFVG